MNHALMTTPGVTRAFGLGDIGSENLRAGWAAPEENHNWNDGFDASLVLHLPNSTKPSALARTPDHRQLGLCFQSMMLHPRR